MQDEAGFTAWARQHQRHLLRIAFLISGDAARAEDLVQEALVKIAVRWPGLGENPINYARTVIYHDHISWWRRIGRRERPVAEIPDAVAYVPAAEQRLALVSALSRLSLRQRQVLVMRYFDDLSEAECAVQLRISVGTVKSTVHDAVAALRVRAPELAAHLTKV